MESNLLWIGRFEDTGQRYLSFTTLDKRSEDVIGRASGRTQKGLSWEGKECCSTESITEDSSWKCLLIVRQ